MIPITFPLKLDGEVSQYTFDFQSAMLPSDTINSAEVSIVVFSGTDPSPSSMIQEDSITITDSVVTVLVEAGVAGVVYVLQASVQLNSDSGYIYSAGGLLAVLSSAPFVPTITYPSISGNAPDGYVGDAYSFSYTVTGGTPPYVVTTHSGTLPAGLSLSSAGVLSGTPTTAESAEFTVRVTDAVSLWDDLPDTVNISGSRWFFGPVNENGISGGSTAFYLTTTDPTDWSGVPIAIPAPLTSIGRISVAGSLLFFHAASASENAMVSSDGGGTWTEADHPLFDTGFNQYDVYYNGAYYYWGDVRSEDGIAWTATPNFPAITISMWFARESDGLFLVAGTDSNIYTTLDDAATAFTTRTNPYSGNAFFPFESNGTRIVGTAQTGIGNGYSDDIFATAAVYIPTTTGGTKKYANDVWIGQAGEFTRSEDGATWATALNVTNADSNYTSPRVAVDAESDIFAVVDCTAVGSIYVVHTTTDGGLNWTAQATLYGPSANLVFVRFG